MMLDKIDLVEDRPGQFQMSFFLIDSRGITRVHCSNLFELRYISNILSINLRLFTRINPDITERTDTVLSEFFICFLEWFVEYTYGEQVAKSAYDYKELAAYINAAIKIARPDSDINQNPSDSAFDTTYDLFVNANTYYK